MPGRSFKLEKESEEKVDKQRLRTLVKKRDIVCPFKESWRTLMQPGSIPLLTGPYPHWHLYHPSVQMIPLKDAFPLSFVFLQ